MTNLNAMKHGLTNFKPVVLEPEMPEFDSLREELLLSLKPAGFLQELTFRRIVHAAWNMRRAMKFEDNMRRYLEDDDPMGYPEHLQQAQLYQRYYLRFEGSYRSNLRELERLQRLQAEQAAFSGAEQPTQPLGALYDVLAFQRAAKQTRKKPAAPPETGHFAERNTENPVVTPGFAPQNVPPDVPKTPKAA